jgi:hypothetical protein
VKAFACITAVVLVAIGIGLAFVGGSLQEDIYGHGALSFAAAFPWYARPAGAIPSGPWGVFYTAWNRVPQVSILVQGAIQAHPQDLKRTLGGDVASLLAGGATTMQAGNAITSWPPTCSGMPGQVVCRVHVVIRENGVIWGIWVSSSNSSAAGEAFVDSFHPET